MYNSIASNTAILIVRDTPTVRDTPLELFGVGAREFRGLGDAHPSPPENLPLN